MSQSEPPPDGGWRRRNAALLVGSAGLMLASSVVVGVAIGYLLDRWLGTRYLVIVFAVLGVIAGFVEMIRAIARAGELEAEADREQRERAEPRER